MGKEEAERSHITKRTYLLSLKFSSGRLTRILDHVEIVSLGDFLDPIYLARTAQEMDRDECLGLWPNRLFDLIRDYVERLGVYVDQNGRADHVSDRVDGCCPGYGGGHDLAPLLDRVRIRWIGQYREGEKVR